MKWLEEDVDQKRGLLLMESSLLFGDVQLTRYHTFTGQTGGTNKEIHFPSLSSPSAIATVLVTINGAVQGEWDGQVTIPA